MILLRCDSYPVQTLDMSKRDYRYPFYYFKEYPDFIMNKELSLYCQKIKINWEEEYIVAPIDMIYVGNLDEKPYNQITKEWEKNK